MSSAQDIEFGLDSSSAQPRRGGHELSAMSSFATRSRRLCSRIQSDRFVQHRRALPQRHDGLRREHHPGDDRRPDQTHPAGTAVTVLSTQDPVRVYTEFATLDAVSNGRAQLIAGRGSLI